MDVTVQLFKLLFELQQLNSRKTGLVLQIAQHLATEASLNASHVLRLHERDEHGRHYDLADRNAINRDMTTKLGALRREYDEVHQQIKELEFEIQNFIEQYQAR